MLSMVKEFWNVTDLSKMPLLTLCRKSMQSLSTPIHKVNGKAHKRLQSDIIGHLLSFFRMYAPLISLYLFIVMFVHPPFTSFSIINIRTA
ncbi:unnamed protein product, partial [Cylicocyclus nassatus]